MHFSGTAGVGRNRLLAAEQEEIGMSEEPDIIVNGVKLTTAQAVTMRVALMDFLASLHSQDRLEALGEIGHYYRHHAREVSCIMHPVRLP